MASGTENGTVPQWKRDLIQRRRQQSKVLASNGASVKLCSAVIGLTGTADPADPSLATRSISGISGIPVTQDRCTGSGNGDADGGGALRTRDNAACTAILKGARGATSTAPVGNAPPVAESVALRSSVAYNMRLEADASLCSDSEDALSGVNGAEETDKKNETGMDGTASKRVLGKLDGDVLTVENGRTSRGASKRECNSPVVERINNQVGNGGTWEKDVVKIGEDCESDSSEELQYGPGIVNKLKSKYLNLTLRETNRSRASVQRFRRAASLEDLLDREDESEEKSCRKYVKRNIGGVCGKAERYRNTARGNESMKRARSVETLLRYNIVNDDGRLPVVSATRQEPVNDHIVLIDRSSVKIESRLGDSERPKPLNKPKRIKPVLAETERPPPDLVKTTMRIFECSAKKLKPKGEVAAKVATFKTINDTFKAQNQKKIVPKPPLQPKPFINGTAKTPGSPKKIVSQKSTAEMIERQLNQDEYRNDGVITDPIVQSVSSVVSKFQQIEKALSPSPSPEPSYKLRFSPAPSPEPSINKRKNSLEMSVKSPPSTPVSNSPRVSPPRVPSPGSPKKECIFRQSSSPISKLSPSSPNKENLRQFSSSESTKPTSNEVEEEVLKVSGDGSKLLSQEIPKSPDGDCKDRIDSPLPTTSTTNDVEEEVIDGPRTISKLALDNIGKAGTTFQFSFNNEPTTGKSYLPGVMQNGQQSAREPTTNDSIVSVETSLEAKNKLPLGTSSVEAANTECTESVSRLQSRSEPEKSGRASKDRREDSTSPPLERKPIGAISSLGLVRTTTTTAYPQGNESKTIRCQKSESSSPPQKQIGIIRPLVSTKTQLPQQNLSNRELEKNLINRVKSIEQPTKVVVSLKSADEIQPVKKSGSSSGGLWDTKPWNQQNNTMVFNFSNRKDVPDYIENDGLIIRRKQEKPKVGEGGIIVLDATLDASTTDEEEWEMTERPPSPCDVSFLNDNVLINGKSNLSKQPRNHKYRIQFDDTATSTFEYPSEASMLEGETSSVDGDTSGSGEQSAAISANKPSVASPTTSMTSLLGGGGLANFTPSKVDLASEGFELGVTRAVVSTSTVTPSTTSQPDSLTEVDYLKPAQDAGAWGSETTTDLLF
ncbi:uncharacterized protein LOC105703844 [Orussus abietinus]|uniref:uncharacterized protein LOC105703844 n=1 Tax=Orussus abietinus TaxID=222816 RepID=UPI0006265AB0|nr:uncharacterized protein LOC105703844 [Orussus abietinus]